MGLRQRKPLPRSQTSAAEPAKQKSLSRSPKSKSTRSNRSNASIKLVTIDEHIENFLNPNFDFSAPVVPAEQQPVVTESRVQVAVKTLGKLESEVIAALFPPNGEPPATMEEISRDLGMSVAEVQNIADEALRGLRGLRTGPQRLSKAWN